MPFDAEFSYHLHELMVEVSGSLRESEAKHKAELIFKAQKTHNAAAMPSAYNDAAIHALRTRVNLTIEKSIEALSDFGIEIDAIVERDMIHHITMLTGGPSSLDLPPGLNGQDSSAIQRHYATERARVANQMIREGTNRLRVLKMKSRQIPKTTPARMINNYNAPIGTVYNNSVHRSITNFHLSESIIQDIERASDGQPALESAAKEVVVACDEASKFTKVKNWVSLLASLEGVTEKVVQQYPKLVEVIRHIEDWVQ